MIDNPTPEVIETDIGYISAYSAAVEGGYKGTYEEFCEQQAGYAENAQSVADNVRLAQNAANEANNAKTAAESAKSGAESAKEDAQAATSAAAGSASSADSSAAAAAGSASAAASSASAAKTSADNAEKSVAEVAEMAANIIDPTLTSMAKAAPAGVVGEISEVEEKENLFDINALKANGVTIEDGVASAMSDVFCDNFNWTKGGIPLNIEFEEKTQYTLSFESCHNAGEYGARFTVDMRCVGNYANDVTRVDLPSLETTYTKHIITSKAGKTLKSINMEFHIGTAREWHFKNFRLIKGVESYTAHDSVARGKMEEKSNKVTHITAESTDEQYPSARAVYEFVGASSRPIYSVSGVGGANTTLTRTDNAVGLTAAAGTDTTAPVNDFDTLAPFNRRKCVGFWSQPDASGKAKFTVKAYAGDPDYAEDGTMGDYVAIEVKPLWFRQDLTAGEIAVSPVPQFGNGWQIHPLCLGDNKRIRAVTYGPCYNLAQNAEGHAVTLPGLYPSAGSYKALEDICKTYGGGNSAARLLPEAWFHYNWLLFTIEYATTHAQSVMFGAANMPLSETAYKVTASGTDVNFVITTAATGDKFKVGQAIYLESNVWAVSATGQNCITAIEKCTEDGTLAADGTYRKITFDGAARTVTAGTTNIASRPWKTGSCNSVLTPSGSPISNTSGLYPMRYRYWENFWGCQFNTVHDSFCYLDSDKIVWYKLTDAGWVPASTSSPTKAELDSDSFVKLTPTSPDTSGYIKTLTPDPTYPEHLIPTAVGATADTFFADQAWLKNGTVGVRSFRKGSYVNTGTSGGSSSAYASYAPSRSYFNFGGGLYFNQ